MQNVLASLKLLKINNLKETGKMKVRRVDK
jgi:hypothetical protein